MRSRRPNSVQVGRLNCGPYYDANRSGYSMDAGTFGRSELPEVHSNVELHVDWFDDSRGPFLDAHDGDVAFVHVDSDPDIYSSARTILSYMAPRLRPGSIIVFDEYSSCPAQ